MQQTVRHFLSRSVFFQLFLLTCGWATQLLAANELPALNTTSQPNIVIFLVDDQGWADVGYHNEKVYSPNLDKLARTGAIFTQHYVMPQCTPTRVALLTGRYPSRFGGAAMSASNAPAFPKGTPTLASMLQSRGYETYLCGKWHLGSNIHHGPQQFGFDESYGSLAGAVGMYNHRYRAGKFADTWHRNQELIPGAENGTHATDLVANEAIKIIRRKRTKPFFLYIPFHAVHTPLDERGEFIDQPTRLDASGKRWLNEDRIQWFNDPAGKIQSETEPEKRLLLAAVHHVDHAIGKIIQAIDDTGVREETLILFSSDNGPQVNWPGNAYPDDLKLTDINQPLPMRGKKLDVYEGGIHVPGCVNWKGKISSKKLDLPMHIVDWLPTLESISRKTGLDGKQNSGDSYEQVDGIDLSEYWLSGKPFPERDLYWTWNQKTNRWALRFQDWKIVKYGRKRPQQAKDWQLFNLKSDPFEKSNIREQNPDIVQRLHARFLAQRKKDKP